MDSAPTLKIDSAQRKEYQVACGRYKLKLGKTTRIMGILNLTSDSFSNDGIYKDPQRAKDKALKMAGEGADIIDIGGESTRPGAAAISLEEEKIRVLPVIKGLAKEIDIPISVDTAKAEVAQAALGEGASIVNDISGLRFDSAMPGVIAKSGAGCILMHIQGSPRTMQDNPVYKSLIAEIIAALKESVSMANAAGIENNRIIIDPGIGFGKTTEHNLQILKRLNEFSSLNLPILIGTSRKSFIGNLLNLPVEARLLGTAASVAASIYGGAHILRVHDVSQMHQVAKIVDAILNS